MSSFEDDDLSPPPMIPLTLVFSPEKTTEIAQNEIQEETEVQKQPAEGAQTNEVGKLNPFFPLVKAAIE